MAGMIDHPQRYELANEIHARPFPVMTAPGRAVFLAFKQPHAAAARDRDLDRAHLLALLDRYGAPHPQPGAIHWFGKLGRFHLKWENHSEFVTYTAFLDGLSERAFDPRDAEVFPADWLANAPGARVTSALIRVEHSPSEAGILEKVDAWFVADSVAVSHVVDRQVVIAGDFRIDPAGHMRFAVFVDPETGDRRIGRIIQRLCEIETYKAMSMLGLMRARAQMPRMNELETKLTSLVLELTAAAKTPENLLGDLLAISAELEQLSAQGTYRYNATNAYEAIVTQRIAILREERFEGRQTFAEFMHRRFDPAMRTVKSAQTRLRSMAERAARASDLLRTRVDVARSAESQALLASMDRRADLQLHLQRTVEGLSVVAISYYALNLVLYLLAPFGDEIGLPKATLGAMVMPVVVGAVYLMIRRIRKMGD